MGRAGEGAFPDKRTEMQRPADRIDLGLFKELQESLGWGEGWRVGGSAG